MRHFKGRKGG
ncbi:hypothetical protein YPPY88_3115, partial [Yersinia pestis PY-88]